MKLEKNQFKKLFMVKKKQLKEWESNLTWQKKSKENEIAKN
jgi:hypothetical protein